MIINQDWSFKPDDVKDFVGFVYIIINEIENKYYIGQKKFWFKKKLKPLKGRKNSRHKLVESDWKIYYGSCKALQNDIERLGTHNFSRKILYLCKSKSAMNYYEAREQFDMDVLRDSNSYNGIINCRISKNMLKI